MGWFSPLLQVYVTLRNTNTLTVTEHCTLTGTTTSTVSSYWSSCSILNRIHPSVDRFLGLVNLLFSIISLKLRFHLRIMRMRMMNANATKKQKKHRISVGVLPFVQMWSSTMTKWIPSWAFGLNVNVLSDWKSLHTQSHHRVAHTSHRGNLHWSLNIIHIRRHIRIMYKWNLSLRWILTIYR